MLIQVNLICVWPPFQRFVPKNIYHFKVNDSGDRLWLLDLLHFSFLNLDFTLQAEKRSIVISSNSCLLYLLSLKMACIQSTNNVCSKNEKTINARRLFNGSGMELHLKTKPIITIGGSQKGLLWLQLLFVNISHQWRLFLNRLADVDSEVLLKIFNRDWTLTLNVKRCYFSSFW